MINKVFNTKNISLSEDQIQKFESFLDMFIEKNSVINLSAIRDRDGIIEKHFLDSLMLSKYLELK